MLLRISLGIAILAGAAALYFSHFQVAEKIVGLNTRVSEAETAQKTAQEAAGKAKTEAAKAADEKDKAQKELAEKSSALDATSSRLADQEKRNTKLAEDLTNTTRDRNEAQQSLAAWNALGVTAAQVRSMKDSVAKITEERDTFVAENKILNRRKDDLQRRLNAYEGDKEMEVKLPAGLKGKVIAVDDKYDFVVLDIGGNQGVIENGRMIVNRDGKLVAKVRITRVEPNRSIANILPEWKQANLSEGDQVLY